MIKRFAGLFLKDYFAQFFVKDESEEDLAWGIVQFSALNQKRVERKLRAGLPRGLSKIQAILPDKYKDRTIKPDTTVYTSLYAIEFLSLPYMGKINLS